MYRGLKVAAIVAAAGSGKRMGSSVPKQFMNMDGEMVLVRTIRALYDCDIIDSICIVTGGDYIDVCQRVLNERFTDKADGVVEGGKERQDSIRNAVRFIGDSDNVPDILLIHDGARPFVNDSIIMDVVEQTALNGAAVAAVPVKDTIRDREHTLERSNLFAVQTPQGFRYDIIKEAHEKALLEGFCGTDDAGLVERLGHSISIAHGEYSNIKITTKEDMPVVTRAGTGYDVHILTEGRKLILGGVDIPYDRGLLGHSDADVLVHAIMDALLGAAAEGDIGRHFPDTDPEYKGISSLLLLEHVGKLLADRGYTISNIDATVVAQKPKILPYIATMRQNIAGVLGISENQINIKGTTTEKLGFEGRQEGISSQAICIING